MIVTRETLLNALEYTRPGLSSRDIIEQANCFVFKDGYVWAYNDEVATRCKSPLKDITGAIQAAKLLDILHKLKEEKLNVRQTKSELRIKGKSKEMGVKMEREISLPIEDLDYPKKNSKWLELPRKFSDAIQFVEGCASRDDSKIELTWIHLHPKWVECFDNYQLARYRIKLPIDREISVRQLALKNIVTMTMIEFCVTDNWIHFRNAQKQVFSCRIYLDEWKYDLSKIIEKASGRKITLPKGLLEASEQAKIFSTDAQNVTENYIELELKSDKVIIRGEGQFGWYSSRKKIKYSGEPFKFLIHPHILEELVKDHSECELSEKAMKAQTGKAVFVTALTPPKEKKK